MKELAIVLVSGGVDSCVTAAIANLNYGLALLHLNYRQRTEERELRAFHDIADSYKVKKRLVTDVDYLRQIGGSSLTDESIKVTPAHPVGAAIPATYVPFRNTHLLSIAVSWGEVIAARKIFIGASQPDSPGYPDCRPEYYRAFNRLIEVGTRPETTLEVVTPLINLTKREIVRKGVELGAPLHLTWSCYQRNDLACGVCHSCVQRKRAFQEAGVSDPIPYLT